MGMIKNLLEERECHDTLKELQKITGRLEYLNGRLEYEKNKAEETAKEIARLGAAGQKLYDKAILMKLRRSAQ